MTKTVGRNDLCPCGSGKKYKKCCDQQQVVSIHHLLKNEVNELQKDLYEFAVTKFGAEIEEDFDDIYDELILAEEEDEVFYQLAHACWFILFGLLDDSSTILEHYISTNSNKIKRPKLKQILLSWQEAEPIVGKVIKLTDDEFVVETLWTKETIECIAFEERPAYEGAYIIGMALPFDQQFVLFPFAFQVPDMVEAGFEDFIRVSFDASDFSDFTDYLTESFIEVLNIIPYSQGMVEVSGMDWEEPIFKEVAERFQKEMEAVGVVATYIDLGIILWYQFCQLRKKKIKNSEIYVAALQYLVATVFNANLHVTQSELGRKYGVSANSISKTVREMEEVLAEHINELVYAQDQFFDGDSFDWEDEIEVGIHDEIEDDINDVIEEKRNAPRTDALRTKAQDLLNSAFEATGEKRYKLARQALELDPYHPDAYNILAEQASSLHAASRIFLKGIEQGEKELGKKFFKENTGYFWGLVETRPYMRAKFNYAIALYELEYLKEAIQQFEELLILNPNDNQGVRYLLFIAYLEMQQVQNAKEQLETHPESDARGAFNELLVEILENGFSEKATTLKKAAHNTNKYVIDYLIEKKKLPKKLPEMYSFGDRDEAVLYVNQHGHLWWMVGIREWLGK